MITDPREVTVRQIVSSWIDPVEAKLREITRELINNYSRLAYTVYSDAIGSCELLSLAMFLHSTKVSTHTHTHTHTRGKHVEFHKREALLYLLDISKKVLTANVLQRGYQGKSNH